MSLRTSPQTGVAIRFSQGSIIEEGTTVTVADNASAENYYFSGWTSEDVTPDENGEFVITSDVHFVGKWEKLYTVYYAYKNVDVAIPENAPELPESVQYRAGETVKVEDIAVLDGYVFVGWDSMMVKPVSGEFTMPEGDVLLTGYFKKPVESVEINKPEDGIIKISQSSEEDSYITVIVKPEDATFKTVIYEPQDPDVVIVDPEDGRIIPVGPGSTKVLVYSEDDPTKYDVVTITVLQQYNVTYEYVGDVIPVKI